MQAERLVSRGFTNAEKALAQNYQAGDVVGFYRPYKRLGVEKGDELRVAGVDRAAGTVRLTGEDGRRVAWEPGRIAARAGGVEVYRCEQIELRAGDRIRWTRNDAGLGLVNSQTAEVMRKDTCMASSVRFMGLSCRANGRSTGERSGWAPPARPVRNVLNGACDRTAIA